MLTGIAYQYELLTQREFRERDAAAYDNYSFHKTYTCVNHLGMRFSSKNAADRNIFIIRTDPAILWRDHPSRAWAMVLAGNAAELDKVSGIDCKCSYVALRVIYPVGGYDRT